MDAGVPLAAPVAGIAMGLISEDGQFVTLTDIQGAEDAFGDMDFKVAGTADFITALQLDTKLSGIPAQVLAGALDQALEARQTILDVILDAIPEPRAEMNPHAPRVIVEYIPGDKIGEVIGPKGKIIREITDETGADVDIDDVDGRGVVKIYAADATKAEMALERIRAIANPVIPREGERYFGTVVKTTDFGAFVSLTPGSDGLLHISKLGGDRRLAHADEAVSVGDKLWVEVIQVRDGRKFSLALVDGPDGGGGGAKGGGEDTTAAVTDVTDAATFAEDPVVTAEAPRERTRERSRSGGADRGGERERSRGGNGGNGGDDERTVRRRRRRRTQ
jgi:polyribonucleotide nucleotidyltransferase